MIAPAKETDEVRIWNEETSTLIREIRRVYSQSGMYPNDDSRKPLWTVDWYAYSIALTSDGVHLIAQAHGHHFALTRLQIWIPKPLASSLTASY